MVSNVFWSLLAAYLGLALVKFLLVAVELPLVSRIWKEYHADDENGDFLLGFVWHAATLSLMWPMYLKEEGWWRMFLAPPKETLEEALRQALSEEQQDK